MKLKRGGGVKILRRVKLFFEFFNRGIYKNRNAYQVDNSKNYRDRRRNIYPKKFKYQKRQRYNIDNDKAYAPQKIDFFIVHKVLLKLFQDQMCIRNSAHLK